MKRWGLIAAAGVTVVVLVVAVPRIASAQKVAQQQQGATPETGGTWADLAGLVSAGAGWLAEQGKRLAAGDPIDDAEREVNRRIENGERRTREAQEHQRQAREKLARGDVAGAAQEVVSAGAAMVKAMLGM